MPLFRDSRVFLKQFFAQYHTDRFGTAQQPVAGQSAVPLCR